MPETKTKKILEKDIQKACIDILNTLKIFNFKVNNVGIKKPNGSYIPAQTKGIPDLFIFLPDSKVICCEFKSPVGKQSPAQLEFQKQCERCGVPYWLISSVDVFIDKIQGKY